MFRHYLIGYGPAVPVHALSPGKRLRGHHRPPRLLAYDKAKAYDGYTLFTPHTKVSSWIVDKIQDPGSRKTYLIDMEGNIVHTWKHDHPAFYAELLPNGNLLRAEKIAGSPVNFGGWYGCSASMRGTARWSGNTRSAIRARSRTTVSIACPTATPPS